jgi:L-ribulokinase
MENKRYTLGLDFGTLSVRGVIADELGNCIAEATCDYPHGVMDDKLPSGISLPARFANPTKVNILLFCKELLLYFQIYFIGNIHSKHSI